MSPRKPSTEASSFRPRQGTGAAIPATANFFSRARMPNVACVAHNPMRRALMADRPTTQHPPRTTDKDPRQPPPPADNGQGFVQSPGTDLASFVAVQQRQESDTMLRLAREFPRNEDKILRDALAELERAPEEAGKAYYSIPYTDHSTGRIVKVEGQTIRAAESLGRRWGNIRWAQRVLREDAEYADVESVAVDLETNTWVMKAARIPKLEKRRTGQVIPYDERRWSQVLGGAMSKVTRNAILAVLPAYLKSAYDKKARAIVAGVDPAAPAPAGTGP